MIIVIYVYDVAIELERYTPTQFNFKVHIIENIKDTFPHQCSLFNEIWDDVNSYRFLPVTLWLQTK